MDFKIYRCLIEIKSSILKACGLYLKDVIGSVAHLANVSIRIENPSREDLASYAGLPSWSKDTVGAVMKMEDAATIDIAEVRGHLERMNSKMDNLEKMSSKLDGWTCCCTR